MTAIIAQGARSGLGAGYAAAEPSAPGERARTTIAHDPELAAAGLTRPFAARAALEPYAAGAAEDRATLLLEDALACCMRELDEIRPGWRGLRVGLAIGTSSGAMRSAERLFGGAPLGLRDVAYGAPLRRVLGRLGLTASPAALLLGACASSALALGLGARWLALGRCDLVLAGGFDAVSVFVAAGFEALRATTATPPPRPFHLGRDGMTLGEGAAVLALVSSSPSCPPAPSSPSTKALAYIAGFGASCDAVHLTAPDPTGGGLGRAAAAALRDAALAPDAIDLISAHATATSYNDAAEARALSLVLGARAQAIPVHALKSQLGHTLGAAGALETFATARALANGVFPASATSPGEEESAPDPACSLRTLVRSEAGEPRAALKLSAAFGGTNAALVLTRSAPAARTRTARPVYVTRAVRAAHERIGDADGADPLARAASAVRARADGAVRIGLAAVYALEERVGSLRGAGLIAGHVVATLETNARFFAKIQDGGARAAAPRLFPYTSPNAVCGECAVALGLIGPSFAVGAGAHAALEAFIVAHDLVAAGDAERMVVLAVDDLGPVARALPDLPAGLVVGGAALLLQASPEGAIGRVGDTELTVGPDAAALPPQNVPGAGHAALLPLVTALEGHFRLPICLTSAEPGTFAKITVVAL